jgi:DNA-binding NarL/FixJ family response regulator
MALWMREAPAEAGLSWRELAIVTKALADGRDMTEIGLMQDIARRTVAVLASTRSGIAMGTTAARR